MSGSKTGEEVQVFFEGGMLKEVVSWFFRHFLLKTKEFRASRIKKMKCRHISEGFPLVVFEAFVVGTLPALSCHLSWHFASLRRKTILNHILAIVHCHPESYEGTMDETETVCSRHESCMIAAASGCVEPAEAFWVVKGLGDACFRWVLSPRGCLFAVAFVTTCDLRLIGPKNHITVQPLETTKDIGAGTRQLQLLSLCIIRVDDEADADAIPTRMCPTYIYMGYHGITVNGFIYWF